jgi:hypothetical protein
MAKIKNPFKKKQKSKELNDAATGGISQYTAAGNKPLSLKDYRSFTARQRADAKAAARKAFNNGEITEAQANAIIKRVEDANSAEVDTAVVKMQQGAADKKAPPVKLDSSMALAETKGPKKSTDMSKAELAEKLREQEAAAKPKLSKGGMTKKKAYSRGGLTTGAKSRTGHTDMRKSGLFK